MNGLDTRPRELCVHCGCAVWEGSGNSVNRVEVREDLATKAKKYSVPQAGWICAACVGDTAYDTCALCDWRFHRGLPPDKWMSVLVSHAVTHSSDDSVTYNASSGGSITLLARSDRKAP
jgi:hypothetical protein